MPNITYETHYICHPYTGDIKGNIKKVRDIVEKITDRNTDILKNSKLIESNTGHADYIKLIVPVAAHLLFPEFMSENTFGRKIAMEFCLALLRGCDINRICGHTVSDGMRQEISESSSNGQEVIWRNFD